MSRQSLSWLVRPAHTAGTVSEPGLKGESSGILTTISLSTDEFLDKLIKRFGAFHRATRRRSNRSAIVYVGTSALGALLIEQPESNALVDRGGKPDRRCAGFLRPARN